MWIFSSGIICFVDWGFTWPQEYSTLICDGEQHYGGNWALARDSWVIALQLNFKGHVYNSRKVRQKGNTKFVRFSDKIKMLLTVDKA